MKRIWFIGIDISKKTLDVCIYDPKAKAAKKHFHVANQREGFGKLLQELKKEKINLEEAFVCLEYCGVYGLEIGLFLEGKTSYCFCNPLHIKRSLGLTRGKNDKIDSFKIARFSYLFREELEATKMPSATMMQLKALMAERKRVTKAIVVEKQVVKELKAVLPETFLNRSKELLKSLRSDIRLIEKEIEASIHSEGCIARNYSLLTSMTGIALVNAAMMILCTNNFEGIDNPRSFACYCGVAPFEYRSGTSIRGVTRVSPYANKQMKSELTNAARSAVIHDMEMNRYYKRKREEGKSHGSIMNTIKFKLIARAFAVVKRGPPFVKLKQAA